MAFSHLNSSATFGDDPDIGLSQLQKESVQEAGDQPSSKDPFDPDLPIDFGPSAGLVVGSGLYDTNDDDDLFGEMNERSFGNRGITDADFNFFDDPGFGGMEGSTPAANIQATPQTNAEFEYPKVQPGVDSNLPESHTAIEHPEEHGDPSQIDPGDTEAKYGEEAALVNDSIVPHNGNSQTISPPLSPVEVKKILFPVPDQDEHPGMEGRKQNRYSPVAFDRNIGDWDRKYGSEGKFWFSSSTTDIAANPNDSTSGIPTVGIPSRSGKSKALADASAKPLNDYGTPSSGVKQCLRSSSVSSTDMSDDSDDMASEDGAQPAMLTTLKRKRARSSFESLSPSSEEFAKDPDRELSTEGVDSSTLLGNFLSILSDWSMTGYFSAPQNQALPLLTRNGHQIQIAQLLVDQVAHSSLSHNIDSRAAISDFENEVYPVWTSLEEVDVMGEAEKLDLKSFVSLQDIGHSPIVSDGAMSHQPAQQKETETGVILKLYPPHLRIRRLKNYLEALPPVVSFWETFGLEPAHGPKDISAYCIHPRNAVESADAFLERIGLLYSNCNLGEHVRGDRSNTFECGLASWDTDPAEVSNYSAMVQSLKSFCEELGTALAKSWTSKENIVIYIINPFSHAAAIADICAAFWQLFQIYAADVDKEQALLDELVLQIVPMSFLMSAESIVVPSQAEYLNLALEVYSRCPPKNSGSGTVDSAPPVVLAESLPKSINFKLTSEKLLSLLEERCLHVACSKSLDQRWMTVAWSNNSGSLQRIMSYCLRFRNSNASRNIAEVRNEIWAATTDIMGSVQARWKVIIVNTESIDQEEVDTWTNLAEQHNKTKPAPLELVVLNVNTAPGLSLELPSLPMPMSILNSQPSPAATPSASGSVPSPDQAANSPTPAGGGNASLNALTPAEGHPDAESESVLTDVCDESWSVVLSHRLNNSVHLTEYRPALASGYLFRRRGPTDGDGVFSMNVNLVHTQRPPSWHETLLQDTLKMYRDLATLSRARGTRNVQQNTLPWHIAAAVRGQEILSYVL
ncbi:hypothetical protein PHISP_00607 [Aspergillus sp. HF37]|nr:hypothetical protein PHISP_00607 [Aspergillus sp. HF37]